MTEQPLKNLTDSEDEDAKVADLMSPALGVFNPDMTVADTVEELRELTRSAMITYCYVTEEDGRLVGVVVMRDMLLATPETRLDAIMLKEPYYFTEDMELDEALKAAVGRHYPVYPVCDSGGHLKGLIRGEELFRNQAIEISAQSGKMVGVDKEERFATPFLRSLRLRHPWLQINLLTAFGAAAVVGMFESTIDQLVVLAVFLPVMAGQTGNTGLQALAVALRGITLGELTPALSGRLMVKETALGFLNGLLVGLTAALGMFIYASTKGEAEPLMLSFTVLVAMVGSCTIAGFAGAVIPLTLKRLGADPATASGIFLTTASDIASMGMFLTFATLLLL
ncbi:MAG TPA: magnesium transporter [Allosphingosinicella sp.]|nr:magnesium transporter [Allosphingosinicella sp.]